MANLKPAQKQWIVAELAMYGRPSEIAERFKEKFGVAIDRGQVHTYDAGREHFKERMSADLVALFDRVREAWDKEAVNVPIANKRWRLDQLQEMYDGLAKNAVRRKAAVLEQAAKEAGDAFTNKRDITSGGKPFKALVGVDLDDI